MLFRSNATTGLQQLEWRETGTDDQCHSPALPSLRCSSAHAGGGWVLNLGFRDQTLGKDWGGLQGNSLKVLEPGATPPEGVCRGSLGHLRGQAPFLGGCVRGGAGHAIADFVPMHAFRWQDTAYTSSKSYCQSPPLTPCFRSSHKKLQDATAAPWNYRSD